jgi:hypothetical protein
LIKIMERADVNWILFGIDSPAERRRKNAEAKAEARAEAEAELASKVTQLPDQGAQAA